MNFCWFIKAEYDKITSSSVPGGAGLALLPTTLFFLAWAMRCFRAVADVVFEVV